MAQSEAHSVPEAEIPDPPRLAPDVVTSGEMQEGGFEHKQWLVQRNGQFVQVTELLYRIIEATNGQRSLADIARQVTDSTGRNVSENNVRTLIARKLIPLGLVVKCDGGVEGAEQADAGMSRSPLRIAMRTTVLSPRLINPVTAVLMQLYRPPILIAILLATAVIQGWVYFVHGVGGAVHQALYQPGLMLVLLGFIVASAAFHEFGHASALRYGGGEVRGMGVGLYLVYPAFYTDVTDNYRLARWDRIRTDLGGFYFNLIFALATIGLYALTRWEFLLLVVILVDLEIIHQSLPFVRLDGYWALADLTGLPDFFSQIMPFVRSVLPIPNSRGRTLPDLKGWVKAVFALYILITVPLLIFLFAMMVINVPRILGTSWDSLGRQVHTLQHAQTSGDVLGMVMAAVQIILLALPSVGTIYILVNVARRLALALWRWSKPTPGRRVAGSAIAVAAVALLLYLWAPRLPTSGPSRSAAPSSGPLYAIASFEPIGTGERGTLGDALASTEHAAQIVASPQQWHPPPVTAAAAWRPVTAAVARSGSGGGGRGSGRRSGHGTGKGKPLGKTQGAAGNTHATVTPGVTLTSQATPAAVTPTGSPAPATMAPAQATPVLPTPAPAPYPTATVPSAAQ